MKIMKQRYLIVTLLTVCCALGMIPSAWAQSKVKELIRKSPSYASCNYYIYPDSITSALTPSPEGKKPFYISHYGRHGSRYISSRSGYDIPYVMMQQADSLDELTPEGQKVLQEMNLVMRNTENRWGELTGFGKKQMQQIGQRMAERFPEVLCPGATVTGISTTVPRCIESMGACLMQMLQVCPHYELYTDPRMGNTRLMELIFKNPDIVKEVVDEGQFSYYLMKMGLFQLNINYNQSTYLMTLFDTDDLYLMWQIDNALWYIQHGACKLNGGSQPYSQRYLLRQLIADADSCIRLDHPGAQLRFGHETVILPLVCLIGVNGFDLETDNLDELEEKGWWCSSVFPMGCNLQFIFYRSHPKDPDVLFKVLLNEEEATLPLQPVSGPYYRWADFRHYCLDKLSKYQK